MASTHDSRKTWTSWRKANHAFFEKHLTGKQGTLLDLGAGPEQFRDITWKFDKTSADFKQYGTTDVVFQLTDTLPFSDNSFDIVFASNFFEHIPYPLPILKECNRILKDGGMLIATTPFLAQIHQEPYDYNRYTKYMIERLLGDAGFSAQVEAIGSPLKSYVNMQDQCFSNIGKMRNKRIVKYLKTTHRGLLALTYPLLTTQPTDRFCQGYGWIGTKI